MSRVALLPHLQPSNHWNQITFKQSSISTEDIFQQTKLIRNQRKRLVRREFLKIKQTNGKTSRNWVNHFRFGIKLDPAKTDGETNQTMQSLPVEIGAESEITVRRASNPGPIKINRILWDSVETLLVFLWRKEGFGFFAEVSGRSINPKQKQRNEKDERIPQRGLS